VLLLLAAVVEVLHFKQEAMLVHQHLALMAHRLHLPDTTRPAVKVQPNLLEVQVDCEVLAVLAPTEPQAHLVKVEPLVQRVVAAAAAVTTAVVAVPWNVIPARVAVARVGSILFQ
jgi:hypothetical protein